MTAARSPTEADRPRLRRQIETVIDQAAFEPLAGLATGDRLVNVLEINLRLDRELPAPPAK